MLWIVYESYTDVYKKSQNMKFLYQPDGYPYRAPRSLGTWQKVTAILGLYFSKNTFWISYLHNKIIPKCSEIGYSGYDGLQVDIVSINVSYLPEWLDVGQVLCPRIALLGSK